MIDIKAASISGVRSIPKARILYQHGVLRAYDKAGHLLFDAIATAPRLLPGWRGVRESITTRGPIRIQNKCMTCGGHWRVAWTDANKLWGST